MAATLVLWGGLLVNQPSQAQGRPHPKVALDLADELSGQRPARARWSRDINGARHVQAIVVSNSADPEMRELRQAIVRGGGSVLVRHSAIQALTVLVKASALPALADRPDVTHVAPNRETQRSASTRETMTGALGAHVRPTSSKTSYTGLDGTGIGIAVLDSGVMKAHEAFLDGGTSSRVKRNVDVTVNTSTASTWITGTDGSASSLMPGSTALTSYENVIKADAALVQDPYGHGTHVTSVAAGRARTYISTIPDTTGIAPNANIYDVKVLNGLGRGTLSDALEGIQWVLYNARRYNIRVLNVSLAANSSDSWQTDPLCAALRSATAMGITVVVAAGNYGTNFMGQTVYGSISSPGHEPSVITVGAVNPHTTQSTEISNQAL